jgi:transcriptional regulator with XRE-family HTH domain
MLAFLQMLSYDNYYMSPAFGKLLRQLRDDRGWTVRELARRADLAFPNVALMESGKRACGAQVAEKLAWALGLDGREAAELRWQAAQTSKRKPTETALRYSPALWRWLAPALAAQQVRPDAVELATEQGEQLRLVLQDGRVAYVRLQVRFDPQTYLQLKPGERQEETTDKLRK